MSVRSWLPHVLLGVFLSVVVVLARTRHETEADLRARWEEGDDPAARLLALFVLVRRGEPYRLSPAQVRELLASEDPRLREVTMTPDIVRGTLRRPQERHYSQLADPRERTRCEQWLRLERRGRARTRSHEGLVRYLEATAD